MTDKYQQRVLDPATYTLAKFDKSSFFQHCSSDPNHGSYYHEHVFQLPALFVAVATRTAAHESLGSVPR